MKTIDACGRSCPEPVILAKKAVDSGEKEFDVLVDNKTAAGNVTRFAQNAGFEVKTADADGVFRLSVKRK